jgi:hypothetical protein
MKKEFVAQWWQKDCSIFGLFNELIKNNKTVNYIKIEDDTLILIFHKSFEMKVVFSGGYFNTYINDKFDYNIEEQDIYEYIEEIINDTYVFIEYKSKKGFFKRRYFDIILKSKFSMNGFRKNSKIVKSIFTIKDVLFDKN